MIGMKLRKLPFIRISQFLQDPHGITSQKTDFFIITAVRTSNLTNREGKICPSDACTVYKATEWILNRFGI
jgi:hypothetical protein